jgi:energy-coupling factor transport system ATP-binding protein
MRNKQKTEELLKRDSRIPEDSAVFLDRLSFSYEEDSAKLLDDVSLDIKKGQVVSVIGHNGAGKSTMAKLIDGILEQTGGDLYLFGVRMTDQNALLLRKDVGMVFQNPDSQFIGATVKDDIAFGLENLSVDPKKMDGIILACAKEVGMEDFLERSPETLSGGQKQRVALAGMIARHPNIMILDEAGAMLDPKGKEQIRNIIREKKKRNPEITILNITHEIDEAYEADRVIVLNDGKIVLDGTPDDVFTNDKLLLSMSLDIPFTHKLVAALKKRGIDPGKINSEQELLEALCR